MGDEVVFSQLHEEYLSRVTITFKMQRHSNVNVDFKMPPHGSNKPVNQLQSACENGLDLAVAYRISLLVVIRLRTAQLN